MNSSTDASTQLNVKLRLTKFLWDLDGSKTVIDFKPGLNLLHDRSQTERTVILRLIRFAMGGSSDRIDESVRQHTKEVRLEFEANGNYVVTSRSFEHPSGKFSVRVNSGVEMLKSPLEMGTFLLELLLIPQVYYSARERNILISFNDLARAFVVDRDFSYTEILNKMFAEPRKQTVRIMLGLVTQEIADVEEEQSRVEAEIEKLGEEIKGIRRMLSDFQVGSLIEIQGRRNNLQQVLQEIEQRELNLRQQTQQAISSGTETKPYIGEKFNEIRERFVVKRKDLQDVENEATVLRRQIQEKEDLKEVLQDEVNKIDRRMSSQFVLSTFTFSRCPRCLQPIEDYMREREADHNCMLCNRPLTDKTEDAEEWTKSLNDSKQAVAEAEQLLSFYRTRIIGLNQQKDSLLRDLGQLESELTRQTQNYIAPLVEDLSITGSERTEVLNALYKLDLEENQRRYIDRLSDEELPNKEKDLEQLKSRLVELKSKRGRETDRYEAFLSHFRSFLRHTASGQFHDASWDAEDMLPDINDQKHTQVMSGPDLVLTVLAFHYALAAMKVKPPAFDTAHPGLLIVDEPEQQKMEPFQFQRIMEQFAELADTYHDDIQIVVALTTATGFEQYITPISAYAD